MIFTKMPDVLIQDPKAKHAYLIPSSEFKKHQTDKNKIFNMQEGDVVP